MTAEPQTDAESTPAADPTSATIGTPSPRHVLYRLWNGVLPDAVCQAVIDTFESDEFYEATIQTNQR